MERIVTSLEEPEGLLSVKGREKSKGHSDSPSNSILLNTRKDCCSVVFVEAEGLRPRTTAVTPRTRKG